MSPDDLTLRRILGGRADANIAFAELRALLRRLRFDERVRGSHHIFTHEDMVEILNLQPRGAMAKPYQVRQVRNIPVRYHIAEADDE